MSVHVDRLMAVVICVALEILCAGVARGDCAAWQCRVKSLNVQPPVHHKDLMMESKSCRSGCFNT